MRIERATIEEVIRASGTSTASTEAGTEINVKDYKEANFFLAVSAVNCTTCDIRIDTKDSLSDNWHELEAFSQVVGTLATAEMKKVTGNLGSYIRSAHTLSGTTITYSVGAVLKG